MTIPTKRNAARTGLLFRSTDPETDVTAEEFNELVDRLEAVEAVAEAPNYTFEHVAGEDDFTEFPALAWVITRTNGGTAVQGDNTAAYGVPDSGVFGLAASTDAGSKSYALRALTGLVRDTDKPIVVEWQRASVLTAGVVSDDACAWLVGLVDGTGPSAGNGVFLFAALDPGREFNLAIVTAGVAVYTPVVLPALGAEDSYRIRLTVLPGSVVLEAAINDEDLVEIETVTAATPAVVYHPAFQIEKSTGAGDRTLLVGRVTWDGYRTVATAAAGAPFLVDVETFATKGDVEDVEDDLATLDGVVVAHVAASNPHSGSAPTSRTLTAGAGLTGGGDLSADRTFNVAAHADGSIVVNANDVQVGVLASDAQHGARGGGTQHSAATTSVAGFMSAEDKNLVFERKSATSDLPEDFLSNSGVTATQWVSAVSGAGAAVSALGSVAGHPGIVRLAVGTTTTGRSAIYRGMTTTFRIGTDAIDQEWIVRIETLSDGTDEYDAFFGFSDNVTLASIGRAIGFFYDRNTSTNWLARTTGSGGTTNADTGIAVAAGAWVRLGIRINAAATSIQFLINGAVVATVTTNIPGVTDLWGAIAGAQKSAGTTSRSIDVDYAVAWFYRLAAAR